MNSSLPILVTVVYPNGEKKELSIQTNENVAVLVHRLHQNCGSCCTELPPVAPPTVARVLLGDVELPLEDTFEDQDIQEGATLTLAFDPPIHVSIDGTPAMIWGEEILEDVLKRLGLPHAPNFLNVWVSSWYLQQSVASIGLVDGADVRLSRQSFVGLACLPEAGVTTCQIHRERSVWHSPRYRLYLDPYSVPLLTARARTGTSSSSYVIIMGEEEESGVVCAKVRADLQRNQYTVFRTSALDDKAEEQPKHEGEEAPRPRDELAYCSYDTITSKRKHGSPSKTMMRLYLPEVGTSGEPLHEPVQPAWYGGEGLAGVWDRDSNTYATAQSHKIVHYLHTMPSRGGVVRWIGLDHRPNPNPNPDSNTNANWIGMDHRPCQPSVKNFQLTSPGDPERALLQFGRVGRDEFTLSYRWPVSPLQAFGICLSVFDRGKASEGF